MLSGVQKKPLYLLPYKGLLHRRSSSGPEILPNLKTRLILVLNDGTGNLDGVRSVHVTGY